MKMIEEAVVRAICGLRHINRKTVNDLMLLFGLDEA